MYSLLVNLLKIVGGKKDMGKNCFLPAQLFVAGGMCIATPRSISALCGRLWSIMRSHVGSTHCLNTAHLQGKS